MRRPLSRLAGPLSRLALPLSRLAVPRLALTGRKRTLAWVGFGFAAFLLFLFLTFPYDAVRARIQAEADQAGLYVRMDSLGPGFLGVSASNVRVTGRATGTEIPPPPLVIDSLTLGPSLFPLGFAVRARLMGGHASAAFGSGKTESVRVEVSGLDPQRGSFKAITGADLEGRVDGKARLEIPAGESELDLSRLSGTVALSASGLLLKGGTVTLPLFGTPTPVDLPRVALGKLDAELRFEQGAGTVQRLTVRGDDLEANATGTLKMARRIEYAEPNLTLRIKADPAFVKRLGLVGSGLTVLPEDPAQPGFRIARVSGYVGKPVFTPGR